MPYGGEPSIAPRSAKPYGGEPGSAPRSALPYDGEPGSAPRSALPYDGDPGSAPRSGTPYGSGPTSASRSAKPYGGEPSSAPRSATPYGGRPGSAPRSGIPYGETAYGSAPTSAIPSSGPGYGASAPASGIPYGGAPDGPRGGYGSAAPTSAPRASGVAPTGAPRSGTPYGTGSAGREVAEDSYRSGRRRAAGEEPGDWRADLDPAGDEPTVGLDVWRQDGEPRRSRQNRRLGLPEDSAPSWAERGESSTDQRQRLEPGEWQRREREERARGSATYRGAGGEDWRRDLADQSNLSEGESRRYGTSDFVPFRSSGSAAVPRSSNLSMTSTSLVSPVPREQREAMARPQRSGNGFPGLTGSYERRAVTGGYPTVRRSDALDPDDEEDEQEAGGPLAAVGYTVVWYGVPVVLFILYMLVLNTGSQTQALDTLAKAAPQFGISLVLSILVAVGLRFVSQSWKAISVGLAAAVVGGGLATVLSSAITGNSLS
jgi:hypothetical protein